MNKTILMLGAMAALVYAIPHAVAADYPTKAFDAKYTLQAATGNTELRMVSDGKGHFRTETVSAGYKSVTITDYLAKQSTTLIDQGKIAMRTKLPAGGGYVCDDASVKSQGGKAIGNKTVAGHPCHGFQYTTPGGKSEVWIGDDCGVLVQSTTDTPAGKILYALKSVSNKAPSPDEFKVPPGYQLQTQ